VKTQGLEFIIAQSEEKGAPSLHFLAVNTDLFQVPPAVSLHEALKTMRGVLLDH
jgi:hypothetical protein